jgi:hypothetical protein
MISSNAIALWGPLETIAYGAQGYLSYVWITNIQYAIDTTTSTAVVTTSKRFLGEISYLYYF